MKKLKVLLETGVLVSLVPVLLFISVHSAGEADMPAECKAPATMNVQVNALIPHETYNTAIPVLVSSKLILLNY